jgi:hypothetical protein
LRDDLCHGLARRRGAAIGRDAECESSEDSVASDPVRLGEAARALPINRGMRQDRSADALLHHQPDGLVVVELGFDFELDILAGEQRLHRSPQTVAENERGIAQLVERDYPRRAHPGSGDQHHFFFAQPRRDDQAAARDLRQQADIDTAVDDELLQANGAGVNDLELDHRIMPAHAREQLRHDDRTQSRRDAEDDLAAGMRGVSADLVAGAFDIAQDALGAFEQSQPGLGQPHAAIDTGE